jgi:hypothetical protein
MKSQLIAVGIVVVIAVNLFSVSANTNLASARVICVDKYNNASVIPCSDQNAIATSPGGNMSSVRVLKFNPASGKVTSNGRMVPNTISKSSFLSYRNSSLGIKIEYPSAFS